MRILHVIADLERERGGPAHVAVELAELMARRGHRVTIVTTDRGLPPELRGGATRGGAVIEAYPIDRPRFWGTSWALRRRLAELVPETDIVHLHSLYLFHDWAAGVCCRRFGVPYILRPHGTLDPFLYRRHRWRKKLLEKLFQDDVLRRAVGMHYTTEEERLLAAPYALNPRSWVVPIGIDLGAFDGMPPSCALRERYSAIGDRKIVLFFGRLNFKKGVDVTIQAFAALARERDDLFLVLAGPDGGMQRQAERWVAEAGLGDRALFTGMVSGEAKREVLAGSDIFLLPSQAENFGLSVIEAAACGMPVIISDRVNLWREIDRAGAGLVAPPSAEAFARHLGRLLDRPEEARAMGRRGAELVRRDFAWEALAPRYEEMYRAAAGVRAAAPERELVH
jgi:glycosyltransferase involved in cell wall biosynthesis